MQHHLPILPKGIQKAAFLLLTLLIFSSCSSSRRMLKDIDKHFATAPAFEQGFSGFMLYDPEQQEILYQHNAEKYFTPASNTKLFTFYTGLVILGDSVPALKYSVTNDSLIFWGTGDPSFLHTEYPEAQVLEFLKARPEKLFYAVPKVEEEHFGPGWAWDDYNASYSAERASFPMFGNTVSIHFAGNNPMPIANPSYFQQFLISDSSSLRKNSRAVRELGENRFRYTHSTGNKEYIQQVPYKYSSELLVELLSDTLEREVKLLKEIPSQLQPRKTLYSIPTDSLYKRMLQESDNFIAEQILLMAAGELSDSLRSSIAIKYMKENHLKDLPDEPQWVDGSGLSRYNLFSPRTVVRLLEKILEKVPQERLLQLFPAGGESGTLENSYWAEEPYIFAKTGSLSNNHSLSGYLKTKTGKLLIFSFMNSNYVVPSSHIKVEMERILRSAYRNY